jgi:hypothetical protein
VVTVRRKKKKRVIYKRNRDGNDTDPSDQEVNDSKAEKEVYNPNDILHGDTAFDILMCDEDNKEVIHSEYSEIEAFVSTQIYKYESEHHGYTDMPDLKKGSNFINNYEPLKWWQEHEHEYPLLSIMAKKYLSILVASTPGERLFSEAKNVRGTNRHKLNSKSFQMTLFTKSNREMLKEFSDGYINHGKEKCNTELKKLLEIAHIKNEDFHVLHNASSSSSSNKRHKS